MKKSVLCLALSLALVLAFAPVRAAENTPEAENSKANPVDQFTGAAWQKTPEAEKLAFLFGVETAITVEYFVNGKIAEKATKEGKRPVYTLSPFEKGWMKAFKGVNRAEVAKITWPTRREVMTTTIMVFIMAALASIFFFLVDILIRTGLTFGLTAIGS